MQAQRIESRVFVKRIGPELMLSSSIGIFEPRQRSVPRDHIGLEEKTALNVERMAHLGRLSASDVRRIIAQVEQAEVQGNIFLRPNPDAGALTPYNPTTEPVHRPIIKTRPILYLAQLLMEEVHARDAQAAYRDIRKFNVLAKRIPRIDTVPHGDLSPEVMAVLQEAFGMGDRDILSDIVRLAHMPTENINLGLPPVRALKSMEPKEVVPHESSANNHSRNWVKKVRPPTFDDLQKQVRQLVPHMAGVCADLNMSDLRLATAVIGSKNALELANTSYSLAQCYRRQLTETISDTLYSRAYSLIENLEQIYLKAETIARAEMGLVTCRR